MSEKQMRALADRLSHASNWQTCDCPNCSGRRLLRAAADEIEQLRKERDALRASLYCPRCHARAHIPDVLKDNFSFQQWLAQHPCGYQGPDHD